MKFYARLRDLLWDLREDIVLRCSWLFDGFSETDSMATRISYASWMIYMNINLDFALPYAR